MSDIILSASILSADFASLGEQIYLAEKAGVDWIHIDVMDGHFVPNITMGPFIVETCRRITSLPLDVHLMVEKPEQHIDAFAQAGADRISIHIEGNPNVYRTLESIRKLDCMPGIVLNPGTPASSISAILHLVDLILVMTVNPGYSGQDFIPESIAKIVEVRNMLEDQTSILIQADGGISEETLPKVFKAGARAFVAATSIFRHPGGIQEGILRLRKSAA